MKNLINKTLLISILSIMFIIPTIAQTETTHWKYQLDLDDANPRQVYVSGQRNSIYLKLVNPERSKQYDFTLGLTIRKAIKEGKLNVYKTEKANNPYSENEIPPLLDITYLDTMITYHEETYEEIERIFENKESMFPTENTVYQLQQNWNFNESKQELNNSISIINIRNGFEGNDKEKEEILFFIKNKLSKKKINTRKLLRKKRITWAKSIHYYGKFENEKLRAAILSKSHLRKHKIVNMIDYEKMDEAEVDELLAGSVDTLLDYKANDIEPQISIIKEEALSEKNIYEFKILQDFYYDTKTNSILTKIIAIAPAIKKYNEVGDLLYTLPLFWIVYDDKFVETRHALSSESHE